MKRHVQQQGVRQWAGDDLIELQAEPLKAVDGFFKEYGSCILQGCDITAKGKNAYDISAGLIALSGLDVDGKPAFKVVPFSGITNVVLPVFFTLNYSVVTRPYEDNKVKPIAYDYRASVSTVRPSGDYLELSESHNIRFVDVIQNSSHRFMTDAERTKMNGIAEGANKYVHPANHPANMITEDAAHRFMTDAERTKLNGVAEGANKYVHPENHPASMITEDATHRFMTDTEREKLNAKGAEYKQLNANLGHVDDDTSETILDFTLKSNCILLIGITNGYFENYLGGNTIMTSTNNLIAGNTLYYEHILIGSTHLATVMIAVTFSDGKLKIKRSPIEYNRDAGGGAVGTLMYVTSISQIPC